MSLLVRIRGSFLWPMLWKEFVQMRRDRFTLGMMIGLPAVQLVLFGYAIRTEVRDLPTLVLDEARTAESRALVATLENTGNFVILDRVRSRAEIAERIGRGEAAHATAPSSRRCSSMKTSSIVGCPNWRVTSDAVPRPMRCPRDMKARRSHRSASSM